MSEFVEKPKSEYNYSVNGFRGLCIFLVLIFHVENSSIVPVIEGHAYEYARYLVNSFKYGVEMFFMISGYVIIGSLKRHASIRAFLIDRALRIYPTWVPLLSLAFIVGPFLKRGIFATYDPAHWGYVFLTNLFFLPTLLPVEIVLGQAWSLSYEWCFYIISALVAFFIAKFSKKNFLVFSMLLIAGILINFYPRGLFFVPGVILALYEDKIRNYKEYLRFPSAALLVFLLSWRATNVGPADLDTFIHEWAFDYRIIYAFVAFISGTYLFACIVLNTGKLSKFLNSSIMQFYGKISYAFYLWSLVVMMFAKIVSLKMEPYIGIWGVILLFTVLSFIFSTIVSWINWVVIEKYFTRLLKQKLKIGRHA